MILPWSKAPDIVASSHEIAWSASVAALAEWVPTEIQGILSWSKIPDTDKKYFDTGAIFLDDLRKNFSDNQHSLLFHDDLAWHIEHRLADPISMIQNATLREYLLIETRRLEDEVLLISSDSPEVRGLWNPRRLGDGSPMSTRFLSQFFEKETFEGLRKHVIQWVTHDLVFTTQARREKAGGQPKESE